MFIGRLLVYIGKVGCHFARSIMYFYSAGIHLMTMYAPSRKTDTRSDDRGTRRKVFFASFYIKIGVCMPFLFDGNAQTSTDVCRGERLLPTSWWEF